MTDEELDAIEQRAAKATPAPWAWSEGRCGNARGDSLDTLNPAHKEARDRALDEVRKAGYARNAYPRAWPNEVVSFWADYAEDSGMTVSDADAEFIAAARSDVPALVAELRRLREALAYEQSFAEELAQRGDG
jgi:hypothetical protein